jgi:NhaP-type Na+/H+ and K+/H+ antiporter
MLDSVRKYVALPQFSALPVVSAVTLASFGLLLTYDLIHPIAVYLLKLYLMF